MRRFLLVVLMLLPLQWAWANMHITADAAHAVSHKPGQPAASAAQARLETVLSCSLLDDGSGSHSCHDNHAHHSADLGLETGIALTVLPVLPTFQRSACLRVSTPQIAPTIERPKWFAAC